jgi:hypothetical protein
MLIDFPSWKSAFDHSLDGCRRAAYSLIRFLVWPPGDPRDV